MKIIALFGDCVNPWAQFMEKERSYLQKEMIYFSQKVHFERKNALFCKIYWL